VWYYNSTEEPKEEVEAVFRNVTDEDISRSSGRLVVFGDTQAGRHLMVVYEEIDTETVYPITAYDVPRRKAHETYYSRQGADS
jgi:uncharacterized DUF497 family protein